MKIKVFLLSLFLAFSVVQVRAQCIILADSTVCLDEPIGFSVQSSSTVSTISWDFGDGNSSTQINPFHRYNTTGSITVEATVTFSGGGGCTVTKNIFVHDPPDVSVSISSVSNFCLKDNNVCLTDASKPGSTGLAITNRVILWGDGSKTETINPSNGTICHTYTVPGNYTITVDATNSKGCSEFKEIDVEVYPNYTPSFFLDDTRRACDGVTYCFESDSTSINPLVEYFRWDFGDGSIDTTNYLQTCHKFTQDGLVNVRLITRTIHGCLNETSSGYFVNLPVVVIDVARDSQRVKCFPQSFEFVQTDQPRYEYGWFYTDSSGRYGDFLGESNELFFTPPDVGVFYLTLQVADDQCSRLYRDTVRSIGVNAEFKALNYFQCVPEDTVFVCQESSWYRTDSISYFWNFNDSLSTQCTTDMYQDSNLNSNCNFWWGGKAKHLYNIDSCTQVKLFAFDHVNGCIDSTSKQVIFGTASRDDYSFYANNFCMGLDPDNGIYYKKPECGSFKSYINFDSACNRNEFYDWSSLRLYTSTCDPDGWITVGIATVNGSDTVYRSCDSGDYYIDSSNICVDTFWFHNWYKLEPTPKPTFDFRVETCVPAAGTIDLDFPTQPLVRYIFWDWGDGHKDTTVMPDDYDTLPELGHTYKEAHELEMRITMQTDSGCRASSFRQDNVGYYNGMNFDTSVCIGFEQVIYDSLFYWIAKEARPWRDTTAGIPEQLIWDLDDGRGFATTGPKPTIRYDSRGIYTIRMASVDGRGCRDTAVQRIYVGGSKSGIKNLTKQVVCDDIIQFFDSSITITPEDSIVEHKWLFGDGRAPSFLKDPFHFYYVFGEYQITHIIRSANGCIDTSYATLVVDGPVPSFDIVFDTVGCVPYTVEFNNTSKNTRNYIWYFGDPANSTLSTSSDTNVTFTYTQPGTYYISLYGSDSVLNPETNQARFCQGEFPDTAIHPYPVRRVIVVPVPQADFDLPSEACVGEEITFTDRSDPTYRNYKWYISNGDTVSANQQNGKYTFTQPGNYSVFYRPEYEPRGAYMRNCFDTITKYITIRDLPSADFVLESIDCDGNAVFRNSSTGATSYAWTFGDTSIPSTGTPNPSVQFTDSGSFNVVLIAGNDYNCEDSANLVVNFDPKNKVSAGLKISPLEGCVPLKVNFSNIPPYQYNIWRTGDGAVFRDTSLNSYTYDSAGEFTFTYIAIDTSTCNGYDTLQIQVKVALRPLAGFRINTDYCTGDVSFINLSLNAETYNWDFGNGEKSDKENPVVKYASGGLYTVTLTVNESLACRSTFVNNVRIESSTDTNMLIPNVFTPGFDDFNPCYRVDGIDEVCYDVHVKIYNRWGDLVFESEDINDCWDGNHPVTYAPYPSGTYFCIIDLTDKTSGEKERLSGTVTLIRE